MSGRLEGHSHKSSHAIDHVPGSFRHRIRPGWWAADGPAWRGPPFLGRVLLDQFLDRSPRWQTETDREAIEVGRGYVLDARGMAGRAVGPGV